MWHLMTAHRRDLGQWHQQSILSNAHAPKDWQGGWTTSCHGTLLQMSSLGGGGQQNHDDRTMAVAKLADGAYCYTGTHC